MNGTKIREQGYGRGRALAVEISNGVVATRKDRQSWYLPAEDPNLAARFALVASPHHVPEREVKRFIRRYGPLGWAEILDEEARAARPRELVGSLRVYREPLEWILEQAAAVLFALDILDGLEKPSIDPLRSTLAAHRVGQGEFTPDYLTILYSAAIGDISRDIVSAPLPRARTDEQLRFHARQILEQLVEKNKPGFRRKLKATPKGFELHVLAKGLIEVIWAQVEELALGGRLARCIECGAPFVRTDKRQTFCPAVVKEGKSPCAAKHQKGLRTLKKQEGKP